MSEPEKERYKARLVTGIITRATEDINTLLSLGWSLKKGHPEAVVAGDGTIFLIALMYRQETAS